MTRCLFLLLIACLCAGCHSVVSTQKQTLREEGELLLYLQPLPQEAQRLSFSIEEVAAVRDSAVTIPLDLRLRDCSAATVKRQRFLASAVLPEGEYRGLAFRVRQAALKTDEGNAALLVPEQETFIPFPFKVSRRSAQLITLSLKYRDAVRDGFSFAPAFTPASPDQPLPSLVAYVSSPAANIVTVFDKQSGRVTGAIATGQSPTGLVMDRRQKRVYIALAGEDAIEVIDTSSDQIINRVRLNFGDRPRELALVPDAKTLLCVNSGSNTLSLIDTLSLIEVGRISVGNDPRSLAIDPTGQRAYVFNYLAGTMSVIDIAAQTQSLTVSTEGGPVRGAFNRKGDRLEIIHDLSPYILEMEPTTMRVTRRMNVGAGARALKVDRASDLFYVGRKFENRVDIFNPYSLMASDFLIAGSWPTYMTIDGELNNLLLLFPATRTLQIVNLISKQPIAEVDLIDEPAWVTLAGER